ncbi:Hypp8004 [Branchiostoma lanceolatum]|uniref:Hypp8004 protein n=1 Tax=Branchiostoma lanceolatum TaxID=7740 RepID=A0A8K0EG83_BRALA|nr:Hypp8004 [Branchiostoma lanceolatum]
MSVARRYDYRRPPGLWENTCAVTADTRQGALIGCHPRGSDIPNCRPAAEQPRPPSGGTLGATRGKATTPAAMTFQLRTPVRLMNDKRLGKWGEKMEEN